MAVGVFAGIPVRQYDSALEWYKRLLGAEPAFYPAVRCRRADDHRPTSELDFWASAPSASRNALAGRVVASRQDPVSRQDAAGV